MTVNHDIIRRAAYVERAVLRSEDRYHDFREVFRGHMEEAFTLYEREGFTDDMLTALFLAGRVASEIIRRSNGTDPWAQWMKQIVGDIAMSDIPLADSRARYERLKFNLPRNRMNPGG